MFTTSQQILNKAKVDAQSDYGLGKQSSDLFLYCGTLVFAVGLSPLIGGTVAIGGSYLSAGSRIGFPEKREQSSYYQTLNNKDKNFYKKAYLKNARTARKKSALLFSSGGCLSAAYLWWNLLSRTTTSSSY